MLGLLILVLTAVVAFAGGYAARASVSRKRRANRAKYLKWEAYVGTSKRPSQPPAFLVRAAQDERSRNGPAEEPSTPPAPQTSQNKDRRGIHAVVNR